MVTLVREVVTPELGSGYTRVTEVVTLALGKWLHKS